MAKRAAREQSMICPWCGVCNEITRLSLEADFYKCHACQTRFSGMEGFVAGLVASRYDSE